MQSFNEPIARLPQDGVADGSLRLQHLARAGATPADLANVLFSRVCWPCVHLRGRHGWPVERARPQILALVKHGIDAG